MNFQDVMNIMLASQNGYVPGVNGGYGGNHKGVDFNYHNPDGSKVGQDGVNMEHPPIGSPVKGIVTGIDPKNGMVEITDGFGTRHQIWHLNDINVNVKEGQEIGAGQNIGTMGGRGDKNKDGIYGPDEHDQHIHYETRTPNGTPMDPEKLWDNGWGDTGSCYDEPPFSFLDKLYDLVYGIPDSFSRFFTRGQQWVASRDPLTLDLDGDGIETVGINTNNPILFDHDADGVKTATGWIKGDDGLLVLDRNGNGAIDNGKELFGDSTVMSNGQTAADGFAALADLDSNADGQIDVNDTQFGSLKVWRDLNQDGISQANELSTLDQQNIASISLTTTNNNQLLGDGNRIMDLGTYTKTDGTTGTTGATGQTGDVDLTENTFYTDFTDAPPITPEAELLPNMEGSGLVRDLREAASIRGDLASVLSAYSSAGTRAEQIIKRQKAKGELSAVSF